MNFKEITSTNNPLIKEIVQLQNKSRVRKNTGQFIIEGNREIELAINGNYQLLQVLYCVEIYDYDNLESYQTEIIKKGYSKIDTLVLPSKHNETWGLVVNEVMTAGILCIVSDKVGCHSDLIDEGKTGFTFKSGDVVELTKKIDLFVEMKRNEHSFKEDVKAKIENVISNPANINFTRRNIITKGCICKTDKGDVKITSRPGQSGNLQGVFHNN